MNKIKILLTTTSNKEIAEEIAHILVKKDLSPCVQIIDKITSIYKWNDKIEKTSELLLFIKTTIAKVDTVKQLISNRHNYEVPEIIEIDSTILNEKYAEWFFKKIK